MRVSGMGNTLPCAANDWAYIDENDSGAQAKIASITTAYAAKKNVRLIVEPKNYYGNGTTFCNVLEVNIRD